MGGVGRDDIRGSIACHAQFLSENTCATARGDVGSAAMTSSITDVGLSSAKPTSPTRRIEIASMRAPTDSERSAPALGDTSDEHERERDGDGAEHGKVKRKI